MSLNSPNFCIISLHMFSCSYLLFLFVGCPFSLLNNSAPFFHTWFFLMAFSQIWVPFGNEICLLTFLVCSPIILHQFCSHQGGRKGNHMVFLQPFVPALMTSQLSAQVVTWWMGFSGGVGFFQLFSSLMARDVYVHRQRRACVIATPY